MSPEKIARIRQFLLSTRGKFMRVEFTKRSTGELRTMLCRTRVKKYKLDPSAPTTPESIAHQQKHDMLVVFDVRKKAYRMISLEGVKRIKAGGKEYEV